MRTLALSIFLMMMANPAISKSLTVNQLAGACRSKSDNMQVFCAAFITGSFETIIDYEKEKREICIPYNISDDKILNLVTDRISAIADAPNSNKLEASSMVKMIIEVNFMCRK